MVDSVNALMLSWRSSDITALSVRYKLEVSMFYLLTIVLKAGEPK